MNKHKAMPNIRFKGFEDEWKEKKFSTLVNRKSHITSDSSLLSVEYENISPDNHEIHKNFNNKKGIFFQKGDILFGKLRPYLKKYVLAFYEGKAVGDFWVLSPKKDIYSRFAFYLIQTHKFYVVSNLSSGTKMPRSDWNLVSNSFFYVCNIEEQQKIGDFFSKLNKLLDLQQQKIDKLELLKKALLQKLFPKHDKKIPDVRFRGFYDKWEKITFSEIGTVTTGNTPSTKQTRYYSKMGTPWITPSNIDKNGKLYNLKYLSKEGAKIGRIVPAGSVLVTSIASIGKNTLLKKDSAFNQQINAITPKKKYDSYFLYSACNQVSKEMKNTASAGTMQIVNKKEFSRMVIKCPLLSEQQKIGNLLSKVDQLIELENKKLQNFQQVKKCLLQNMFVE